MSYTWIQEIVIVMSDDVRFIGHIMNTDGQSDFESETSIINQDLWMTRIGVKLNHASEVEAYEKIITSVLHYMKKESCTIKSIDNPCNAKYIDAAQQTNVLSTLNINVIPTINGT